MESETVKCRSCGELKNKNEFYRFKRNKKPYECKICWNERCRQYKQALKQKLGEKKYREKRRKYDRKYQERNREKIKKSKRDYHRKRYQTDTEYRERQKLHHKKWAAKNRSFINNRYRSYQRGYKRYVNFLKTEGVRLKKCDCCGEYYPAHSNYFLIKRGGNDGFFDVCKNCTNSKRTMRNYWGDKDFEKEQKSQYILNKK